MHKYCAVLRPHIDVNQEDSYEEELEYTLGRLMSNDSMENTDAFLFATWECWVTFNQSVIRIHLRSMVLWSTVGSTNRSAKIATGTQLYHLLSTASFSPDIGVDNSKQL